SPAVPGTKGADPLPVPGGGAAAPGGVAAPPSRHGAVRTRHGPETAQRVLPAVGAGGRGPSCRVDPSRRSQGREGHRRPTERIRRGGIAAEDWHGWRVRLHLWREARGAVFYQGMEAGAGERRDRAEFPLARPEAHLGLVARPE